MKESGQDRRGRLTVVGTGIRLGQITAESLGALRVADVAFVIISDAPTLAYLVGICRKVVSLVHLYEEGKPRTEIYAEMAEVVLEHVRKGDNVCLVLYGHPGVLAVPAATAVKLARREGFSAVMQPGISAEACLYAELGLDPVTHGVQSYEATGFLLYEKRWDPTSLLIIWQVGVVGELEHKPDYPNRGLPQLLERLLTVYPTRHQVTIYEAATSFLEESRIESIALEDLPLTPLSTASTLVIPPSEPQQFNEKLASSLCLVW